MLNSQFNCDRLQHYFDMFDAQAKSFTSIFFFNVIDPRDFLATFSHSLGFTALLYYTWRLLFYSFNQQF
jgi:hypothetical protein